MKGLQSALLTLAVPLVMGGCDEHNPPGYSANKPEDRQAITVLMTDFACRCAQFGPDVDFNYIKEKAATLAPQINSQLEEGSGLRRTLTLSAVGNQDSALWSDIHYSMTCGPNDTLKAKDPCTSYTADISSAVSSAVCTQLSDLPWKTQHDGTCD